MEIICLYYSVLGPSSRSCSDTTGVIRHLFLFRGGAKEKSFRVYVLFPSSMACPSTARRTLYRGLLTYSKGVQGNAVSPRVVGCCTDDDIYPDGEHNHDSHRSRRGCVEEISGCGDSTVDIISAPTVELVVVDKVVEIFQGKESPGIAGINERTVLDV